MKKLLIILFLTLTILFVVSTILKKARREKNKAALEGSPNMVAFLLMIRYCEGTAGPNGYATVYGYEVVLKDFSDHPFFTGEWKGKRLPDTMCRNAGLSAPCYSTAAGAYQFIKGTWKALKNELGLSDFSPLSQDLAAVQLIRKAGAYNDVMNGNLVAAINKCAQTWASLPGNKAGQPQKSIAAAKQSYLNAGGTLA